MNVSTAISWLSTAISWLYPRYFKTVFTASSWLNPPLFHNCIYRYFMTVSTAISRLSTAISWLYPPLFHDCIHRYFMTVSTSFLFQTISTAISWFYLPASTNDRIHRYFLTESTSILFLTISTAIFQLYLPASTNERSTAISWLYLPASYSCQYLPLFHKCIHRCFMTVSTGIFLSFWRLSLASRLTSRMSQQWPYMAHHIIYGSVIAVLRSKISPEKPYCRQPMKAMNLRTERKTWCREHLVDNRE